MIAVRPEDIRAVDTYAAEVLGISTESLMCRAGHAIADAVRRAIVPGSRVVIVCGGGNNGGDGYAAGAELQGAEYYVCVVDLFDRGQKTEAGKAALAAYKATPGTVVIRYTDGQTTTSDPSVDESGLTDLLLGADCVVDAVFGTGFTGDLPPAALTFSRIMSELRVQKKVPYTVAVDVPLGVSAADGSVTDAATFADETVMLSYPKIGLYSYPARRFTGKPTVDALQLPSDKIAKALEISQMLTDAADVSRILPARNAEGHKGTYGTLGVLCGTAFPGTAILACAAALRAGTGLVRLYGTPDIRQLILSTNPEIVFRNINALSEMTEKTARDIINRDAPDAWLIGSGCGVSDGLAAFLHILLTGDGSPAVLDADALNTIAVPAYGLKNLLKYSKRKLIITPHPLEFSRLCGVPVHDLQQNRIQIALSYVRETKVTLLLKGAGSLTIAPDGRIAVNMTGSPALAKGGSGDVLAGVTAAFATQGVPLWEAGATAAYLHGRAGDTLAGIYSEYGVLPRELPAQIAREILACRAE